MTPTMELRFVEREINQQLTKSLDGKSEGTWEKRIIRVLQQKWRHKDWPIVVDTEWRDVPLVKEEA